MEKVLHVQRSEVDQRVALAVHADLRQIGMPRANLLLVGLRGPVQNVVDLLLRDRQDPVASWNPGEPLILPRVQRARTMILRDVGALSNTDQQRLLQWMDETPGWTQVISTSSERLLPRVVAGTFLIGLYYRLNILYVEVPDDADVSVAPRTMAS
jgi:hypothetical protein